MEVVEYLGKGPYLNTKDRFHSLYITKKNIYIYIKQNFVLNDNLGEQMNPIFELCGGLVPSPSSPFHPLSLHPSHPCLL
jgi:hypothetical protein